MLTVNNRNVDKTLTFSPQNQNVDLQKPKFEWKIDIFDLKSKILIEKKPKFWQKIYFFTSKPKWNLNEKRTTSTSNPKFWLKKTEILTKNRLFYFKPKVLTESTLNNWNLDKKLTFYLKTKMLTFKNRNLNEKWTFSTSNPKFWQNPPWITEF